MTTNGKEIALFIVGGVMVFIVILSVAFFAAIQEAETFNKFSEIDATARDAFFADLRVEACRTK
jgi:hypothetical protein